MGLQPNWTEEELDRVRSLIKKGYTTPEIAKIIGRSRTGTAIKVQRVCGGNPNYRRKITKHAYLREKLLRYYMKHSAEECQKRFKFTPSEFKSCLICAYKDPRWKHLRKETRDHSPWTADQLKFLLRHIGLRPRKWIMEQIGRGNNVCHIKERMQALGIASRNMQGLTLSQFIKAFGRRPEFYLQTDAGHSRRSCHHGLAATHWRIVPWVWLEQELKAKRLKTVPELRMLISARALFQEWIFEGNALRKMKRIVRAKAQ